LGEGLHLDIACGYATFLAQLGWRYPQARLVGLNIDFEGANALAVPLLKQADVFAQLVAADARCIPFPDNSFDSLSCFLGLQDIEISCGLDGVAESLKEAVRVVRPGGLLCLADDSSFERYEVFLRELETRMVDRAERELEVRWNREIAELAIRLYADGWLTQKRLGDPNTPVEERTRYLGRLRSDMDDQLSRRGCYVPFAPLRVVIHEKKRGETP
jgi:ubiquinone/menaquinone biosynthesis C-methylase UbiE